MRMQRRIKKNMEKCGSWPNLTPCGKGSGRFITKYLRRKNNVLDSSNTDSGDDGNWLDYCAGYRGSGWLDASPPGHTQGAEAGCAANAPSDKT